MEPFSYAAAFNLALALRGAGDTPAAIECAKRTLQMKPTAELYNLLGSLEESANDYLNAVAHFRKAVDLEPASEQYYFDLGVEYLTHFTFGPALEAFDVGCRKFPTSSRQFVGKGLAHYSLRQYMEGAEALARALEIDPSSPGSYAAWDALQSFLTPLDWERLSPRLRRLSELYPDSAEAKFCYGQGAVRLAQASHRPEYFELAQSMLKEVVRLKPAFADAFFELGNMYAARKENEHAVKVLLEAVRLAPRSERAHYRLGQIYRDLNQLQLAERELSRYSELVTNRHEQVVRSRSASQQFVLAQPGVGPAPTGDTAKQSTPK